MIFKDYIPVGKENKKIRKEIMEESNLVDRDEFKKELAELRKEEIVIFDNGYYIPNKIEEIQDFIKDCNAIGIETNKLIEMGYKKINELEELENERI